MVRINTFLRQGRKRESRFDRWILILDTRYLMTHLDNSIKTPGQLVPWRRPTSCNFTPSSISPVYVVPGLYLFSARTHFCRQSHATSLWQGSFAKLPRKSRTTGSRDLRSVQHRSSICGGLGSDDASLPSHHSVSVADKTSFHSAHPTHSMQWLHFFTDFHCSKHN